MQSARWGWMTKACGYAWAMTSAGSTASTGAPSPPFPPGATWRSPFGVERMGIGYGQPLSHPLADAQSVKDVMDYPWPDPAWVDVSRIKADADAWSGQYAILGGDWSPFWHDVIDLVGMEKLYFLMYDHPDAASLLFREGDGLLLPGEREHLRGRVRVHRHLLHRQRLRLADRAAPGRPTFSSASRCRPCRGSSSLGHRHGRKVMMHCCGGFRPLLPLMIRAGLDGVHALQPFCAGMEPAGLKRDFGAQIVLNGAIDSQSLIEGTPDDAREQTRRVLQIMSPGGGYVAGASHDYILEETPLENVLAMFDTIREYGRG